MPFKDVLMVADHARNCAARVDVASRVARDLEVNLAGAHADGWFPLVSR